MAATGQWGSSTKGALVGVPGLRIKGTWAEHLSNSRLNGWPVLSDVETGPMRYRSPTWPVTLVPTNQFSARWSGVVQPLAQGEHVFYVSAEAGAAFRLRVNGATLIDNWAHPGTNAVEIAGTDWLGTNFDNTNLAGLPVLTNIEQRPVNYTNAWPEPPVPTNRFSACWSGTVQPLVQGDHVFYVQADAGAAFRLRVNGTIIIDNWTNPAPGSVEIAGTNWFGTNVAYDVRLEYIHFTNAPLLKLSWTQPGMAKEIIPADRFWNGSSGATGISIDAAGKVWAPCYDSSTAARIDPNAGPLVVIEGQTNHVGMVDMMVDLGDGSWHPSPYNIVAHPYNYSDMTGFNVRVVNPGLKPLKGYWVTIDDSGSFGQLWNRVSWTAGQTNGCSVEVYVRASDDRTGLGSEAFVPVTNGVAFAAIRGRYIEVRLSMVRDDAAKQPVLYDLTLYGVTSGFAGTDFLYGAWAEEGGDGEFWTDLVGAAPVGYTWYRMWPWETNWVQVTGATNSYLVVTNVDSWVEWTMASVLVTNGNGESLWLGPAFLEMNPAAIRLPATNYLNNQGPATRYPLTINVFGQPTNLASVVATLRSLSHSRSADLSILLVSPSGTNIMLMSNVGGTNGVSNATLIFTQQGVPLPPQTDAIPSNFTSGYLPSNFGGVSSMPGAPPGQYSTSLYDLVGTNPNGVWKLYIYDYYQGSFGWLNASWQLSFTFQ